jgi:glycosyltransferase involved in cell wall biosynthesis
MRVLIISSVYPTPEAPRIIGGAEVFTRQFAESLAASGDGVEVVRAASAANQQMEIANGVTVYAAPVRNIYLPFSEQHSAPLRGVWHAVEDWQQTATLVSERIRAFRPDVMHSNNLSGLTTAVWKVAAAAQIPIVHTLHDYYLSCPRCSRFSDGHSCAHTCLSCKILTVNRRRAAGHVNGVVGVSQRILDIHGELGLFLDTPVRTVIRNASMIAPVAPADAGSDPTITFGFIGRLTEEKGIYNLIHAIAAVPPEAVRLLIAGRTDEKQQKLIRAMAPNARIEFLGFVAPAEFYEKVDVVVVPSIWEEPGPIVVADAKAAGKPFLGTRFGGIPEAIDGGAAGWLTAHDPVSLARSILQLVAEPQRIRDMARKLAERKTRRTFADVIAEYRGVFKEITSRRKAASS